MQRQILFVTGTDTGVGKTVFAALLTRHLRGRGAKVAALKPVCSGGREDASVLRRAGGNVLTLDEVNPWNYRAALSPRLAAQQEGKKLRLAAVVRQIRLVARRFETLVVEGAGGLLSPLGEDFDSRDLITALRATPIIVAPNRLGAINQVRLALEALTPALQRRAQLVLVNPPRSDMASETNRALLAEFFSEERMHLLPRLQTRQLKAFLTGSR